VTLVIAPKLSWFSKTGKAEISETNPPIAAMVVGYWLQAPKPPNRLVRVNSMTLCKSHRVKKELL
jgi:hypothetical protein